MSKLTATIAAIALTLCGTTLTAQEQRAHLFTPSELISLPIEEDKKVNVVGTAKAIGYDESRNVIWFTLADDISEIRVEYTGPLPGLFSLEEPVLVQGKMKQSLLIAVSIWVDMENNQDYIPENILNELRVLGIIR